MCGRPGVVVIATSCLAGLRGSLFAHSRFIQASNKYKVWKIKNNSPVFAETPHSVMVEFAQTKTYNQYGA